MNKISQRRKELGLSQNELARTCGISRQFLGMIESGKTQPNVRTALQLARLLNSTAEELFADYSQERSTVPVEWLGDSDAHEGMRIELAKVGEKWIAHPVDTQNSVAMGFGYADAILQIRKNQAHARLLHDISDLEDNLLIAGCDPALSLTQDSLNRKSGRTLFHYCGSQKSLHLLEQQSVHIAGFHYPGEGDHGNLEYLEKLHADTDWAVFRFSSWDIGWMISPGFSAFSTIEDLINPKIRFANRESGSGARVWLDQEIESSGIDSRLINGFKDEHKTHHSCAFAVQSHQADIAIGPRAIAKVFGLNFIPISEVIFDLAITESSLHLPLVSRFIDCLTTQHFQREVESIAGYSSKLAGHRIH